MTCLKEINSILLNESRSASSLIITTAFPKVFSAGLDLKTLIRGDKPSLAFRSRLYDYMDLFQETCANLISHPLPTASVISGFCPAGGTVLSLCCDVRVLCTQEKFSMGLNEVAVGMAPPEWVHSLARAVSKISKLIKDFTSFKSISLYGIRAANN